MCLLSYHSTFHLLLQRIQVILNCIENTDRYILALFFFLQQDFFQSFFFFPLILERYNHFFFLFVIVESFYRLKMRGFIPLYFIILILERSIQGYHLYQVEKLSCWSLILWCIAVRICITGIVIQSPVSNISRAQVHGSLSFAILKIYGGTAYHAFTWL